MKEANVTAQYIIILILSDIFPEKIILEKGNTAIFNEE